MQYITTTELRTKSSKLVDYLTKGNIISLVHRSKVIGTIEPAKFIEAPPATLEGLRAFLKAVKPKRLTPRLKREEMYRKHLLERYGKGIL